LATQKSPGSWTTGLGTEPGTGLGGGGNGCDGISVSRTSRGGFKSVDLSLDLPPEGGIGLGMSGIWPRITGRDGSSLVEKLTG
jgi:hypothetical protein